MHYIVQKEIVETVLFFLDFSSVNQICLILFN